MTLFWGHAADLLPEPLDEWGRVLRPSLDALGRKNLLTWTAAHFALGVILPLAVMRLAGVRPAEVGLRRPNRLGVRLVVLSSLLAVPFGFLLIGTSPPMTVRTPGLREFCLLAVMIPEHVLICGILAAVFLPGRRLPPPFEPSHDCQGVLPEPQASACASPAVPCPYRQGVLPEPQASACASPAVPCPYRQGVLPEPSHDRQGVLPEPSHDRQGVFLEPSRDSQEKPEPQTSACTLSDQPPVVEPWPVRALQWLGLAQRGPDGQRSGVLQWLGLTPAGAKAAVLSGLVFGVVHVGKGGWELALSFPGGATCAYLTLRTGSIWPALLAHWSMNIIPWGIILLVR